MGIQSKWRFVSNGGGLDHLRELLMWGSSTPRWLLISGLWTSVFWRWGLILGRGLLLQGSSLRV